MTDLRDRFEAVSSHHFSGKLCDRYTVRMTGPDEWKPRQAQMLARAFARENVDFDAAISEPERQAADALNAHIATEPLVHRVLFEDGDEVVGSYWGMQDTRARYYMAYTLIDPAHQGRGLYSAFLRRLMAAVEELGFMMIYSRHHADNNRVLVPKLKAGFRIATFEISPGYGVLVELRYLFNPVLRELHGYRVDATVHSASLRARGIVKERAE